MKNLPTILASTFFLGSSIMCNCFVTPQAPLRLKSTTGLSLSEADIPAAAEDARRLFFLWFFGGSGGGGIALAAFPKMFARFQGVRNLKGVGPTLGGETIGLNPLCGYPEDLSRADVDKILKNRMSVEQMVERGPKDSMWAQRGYLRYEAFEAANKNCNPLALKVIFDAMTTSTSTVDPETAQELLDEFKADNTALKRVSLQSKAKGYSAIGLLLFLLGITANITGEAVAAGWFPDWPGFSAGITTIPDYWI